MPIARTEVQAPGTLTSMPVADDHTASTFCLLVVPGVTMDKWSRMWSERLPDVELQILPGEVAQAATLLSGQAAAALTRLPVDQDTFHAIPLYTEATVVVVPRDHLIAAADEVTLADFADETLVRPLDDVLTWPTEPANVAEHRPDTTADAVELVAASVGILVVPQSLARLYHRRDLTYRVVTDAPTSSVALVWLRDRQTDLVEEMIGIVRGRTANSTRGRGPATPPAAKPAKRGGARSTPPPRSRRGR